MLVCYQKSVPRKVAFSEGYRGYKLNASLFKQGPGSSSRSDRAVGTILSNLHTFGLIAMMLASAAAGRQAVSIQPTGT